MEEIKKIEEQEIRSRAEENVFRVTISKEAEEALNGFLDRINQGFEAGKVTRNQAASWALAHLIDRCDEADIQEIRSDNVNEFAFLESLLKQAKRTGKMPAEVSQLIHKQLGFDESASKQNRRSKPKGGYP
jgi:23S rRNA A2030 N6-methylase RlmJ